LIDKIHSDWRGKNDLLEAHHGYIQWLFPIREPGLNSQATPLQKHEIKKIKENPECFERIKKSYELMLDFYGCKFNNKETGELERNQTWKERYRNLNNHSHNYLRITRILKCLGEFELENYQKNFLNHFIDEIWVKNELTNCENSCRYFWIGTIKNDTVRKELEEKITKNSITAQDQDLKADDNNSTPTSTIQRDILMMDSPTMDSPTMDSPTIPNNILAPEENKNILMDSPTKPNNILAPEENKKEEEL